MEWPGFLQLGHRCRQSDNGSQWRRADAVGSSGWERDQRELQQDGRHGKEGYLLFRVLCFLHFEEEVETFLN
jgi:hypothetical protein